MLLQELQIHFLQQQQAAVLAFAMVVHPCGLQRYNPALQLTLQIHLQIYPPRLTCVPLASNRLGPVTQIIVVGCAHLFL